MYQSMSVVQQVAHPLGVQKVMGSIHGPNCHAIKGCVVCYEVWLGSMKGMGHRTGAGNRAQLLSIVAIYLVVAIVSQFLSRLSLKIKLFQDLSIN